MTPCNNEVVNSSNGAVAYILKGYPRLSEMFIVSEIYRLEQLGIDLRLHVIKQPDEPGTTGLVDDIQARPNYLPHTTSLSGGSLFDWLRLHLKDFLPALSNVTSKRPLAAVRAATAAIAQAVRARRTFLSWPRKLYMKEFLQAAWISNEVLKSPEVRHLHAHFGHGATTVAWFTSIMTGLPFSFTAHAKDIYCESLNPAGLLRRKIREAEFVVTCTESNRQHLLQIKPTANVHCIYHGLNAEFTKLLKQQPTIRQQATPLRALGVGRLVPKKGFDVLVEACGILNRKGLSFETVIVGERGEHEIELRAQISALGLDQQVHLTGPLDQRRLYDEYRQADLFCLPCRVLENGDRDGLPNVLMEAMACGVPVISTTVSGIPEIVKDGFNGTLVPPNDAEALATAIQRMHSDTTGTKKLAMAGTQTIQQKFDGDTTAAELAGLFRAAIKRGATCRRS